MDELFTADDLQADVIPTYRFTNDAILKDIMQLYDIARFHLDPCYSKGQFYKSCRIPEPKIKSDIKGNGDVLKIDCRKLPFFNKTINNIIFDPPFLPIIQPKGQSVMKDRFGAYASVKELYKFYDTSIIEFHRVLKEKGLLIFKCQDFICSGKQNWSHIKIYNMAIDVGFKAEDLFILLAKTRMLNKSKKNKQRHARKFHCFYWVFRK